MSVYLLIAGALVVVGLVGVIVPVLPGSPLVAAGVAVWALGERTTTAWVVLAVALVLLAAGMAGSWLLAGRTLREAGIPWTSILAAVVAAVVGAFVIPVVGFLVGAVAGLYLAELARLGPTSASARSTWVALRAVVVGMVVELAGAVGAAVALVTGVLTSR